MLNNFTNAEQQMLFCILKGALLHGKRCPFDM